jgi:hypothetical protein
MDRGATRRNLMVRCASQVIFSPHRDALSAALPECDGQFTELDMTNIEQIFVGQSR